MKEKLQLKQKTLFLWIELFQVIYYYQFLKLDCDEKLTNAIKETSYKKFFVLDKLSFTKHYGTTENKDSPIDNRCL